MPLDVLIKEAAEKYYQVYREMTGRGARGMDIQRIAPPYSVATYQPAISIAFTNTNDGSEGRLVLIFNGEREALGLAAAIASQVNLPPVTQVDDNAVGILSEFMNTVAGKVITAWESHGRVADFGTPAHLMAFSLANESRESEIHNVSLELDDQTALSLLILDQKGGRTVLRGKKILIVDDSKMIRHLLTTEFERQGCRVSEAENGLDGFIRNQADQPDLIIMDLVMPKMGGLEAIARIREMNPTVHIIVLTSTSKKEEVLTAAKHKVKNYVMKPIQMDQLLEVVRSCFQ